MIRIQLLFILICMSFLISCGNTNLAVREFNKEGEALVITVKPYSKRELMSNFTEKIIGKEGEAVYSREGNLFAERGTFQGTVYAKEVVGEIASGAIVPYTGFSKSYSVSEETFSETYTIARFSVEPVVSGGTIMPSTINTGNIGSVDWVVNGRGYDKTNNYTRKVTATLLNETTGETYTKIIQDETFDGHGGFTDRVSATIPNLVLNVADTLSNYSVIIDIEWELNYGTRDTSTVSLISGNMVVTRIVATDTIRPLFV